MTDLEQSMREAQKDVLTIDNSLSREQWPMCHLRAMALEEGDNGNGGCEVFYECTVCGHTKPHSTQWREA